MSRIHPALIAILTALTAACQPVSGKLTVARQMLMEVTETERPVTPGCPPRDGDCSQPVVRKVSGEFHAGSYDARADLDAPGAIRLVIDPGVGRPAVVQVAIPEGVRLPKTDGRFELAGVETGQSFDTKGVILTTESYSPGRSGFESCRVRIKRRVCEAAEDHKKEDAGRRRCRLIHDSVYGHRAVEFHRKHRTRRVTLDFHDIYAGERLARFSGSATRTTKVYDYRGTCVIDRALARRAYW